MYPSRVRGYMFWVSRLLRASLGIFKSVSQKFSKHLSKLCTSMISRGIAIKQPTCPFFSPVSVLHVTQVVQSLSLDTLTTPRTTMSYLGRSLPHWKCLQPITGTTWQR